MVKICPNFGENGFGRNFGRLFHRVTLFLSFFVEDEPNRKMILVEQEFLERKNGRGRKSWK
jgi:hypothetical protein